MFDSVILQGYRNKLLRNLNSQRIDGKFCNVQLCIGTSTYTVHSCVLAAYCPTVFNNSCIDDYSVNSPFELHFDATDCCKCLQTIIEFMYLGTIKFEIEHVNHLEMLGKFLAMPDLLLMCLEFKQSSNDELDRKQQEECVNKNLCDDFLIPLQNSTYTNSDDEEYDRLNSNNEDMSNEDIFTFFSSHKEDNAPPLAMDIETHTFLQCNLTQIDPDRYTCSKCNMKFVNSFQLRQHREMHLINKVYSCYTCEYRSHKANQLIKHLCAAEHNESVCSFCMLETDNPEKLKKHLELHNHPKPFFCSICQLRFATRASFNHHTPKHSTETPFLCGTCSRGFKWKHHLKGHMITHTDEKKHLCEQCGFTTAHKSTFTAHELSHSFTFNCPHVGCKFTSVMKRNVDAHLATHSKEKAYQCEICGQSFSQAKNMRRHAIKHDASADTYHCPVCNFKTMRYDKLKDHFRKHHAFSQVPLPPQQKKVKNRVSLCTIVEEVQDMNVIELKAIDLTRADLVLVAKKE